ncbi:hypothetical protein B9G55_06440 [Saccharibacillus sp. O16]|nr:hypothetical protein B9G55_06440 [Saccharibacillus sp. O16]
MKRNFDTTVMRSTRFRVTLIVFLLFLVALFFSVRELAHPDKKHAYLEWSFVSMMGLFFILLINCIVLYMRMRKAPKKA